MALFERSSADRRFETGGYENRSDMDTAISMGLQEDTTDEKDALVQNRSGLGGHLGSSHSTTDSTLKPDRSATYRSALEPFVLLMTVLPRNGQTGPYLIETIMEQDLSFNV
ncbi:hypothetical protein KI688_010406 [Linnemannia hyalina]|uniref:Uncharacterized protein n=1 Tax=Linnemannia hyalina TaxID=64524 RepID=A0A9P8BVR0_9FUNG|nr:hypothetical protein KI688_010406 [Linnemannia hyalina]